MVSFMIMTSCCNLGYLKMFYISLNRYKYERQTSNTLCKKKLYTIDYVATIMLEYLGLKKIYIYVYHEMYNVIPVAVMQT